MEDVRTDVCDTDTQHTSQAALAVSLHSIGGHGEDGQMLNLRLCANPLDPHTMHNISSTRRDLP